MSGPSIASCAFGAMWIFLLVGMLPIAELRKFDGLTLICPIGKI
jgi:hypothetical protein